MAFCPKCGHAIGNSERFCAHCGADVSSAAPAAVGQPGIPNGMPAQVTAIPPAVAPPPMTPVAPKKGTTRIVVAVVVIVLAVAYFYNRSHNRSTGTPTQPGTPGNTPSGNTYPALVAQQWLPVQWQNEGGTVTITGSWTNNSTSAIASAIAECDQTDASGSLVTKNDVRLNGPLAPNATDRFTRMRVGSLSRTTTMVTCVIVSVTPASR